MRNRSTPDRLPKVSIFPSLEIGNPPGKDKLKDKKQFDRLTNVHLLL